MSLLTSQAVISQSLKKKASFIYTGAYTRSTVTFNGVQYLQLALTGSGILNVTGEADAYLWMCGAGAGGGNNAGPGGGGSYTKAAELTLQGTIPVTIGAGGIGGVQGLTNTVGTPGSATTFGDITANGGTCPEGGTGGGQGTGYLQRGKGDGVSKYPFGDTVTFKDRIHCPGGAGGSYWGTTYKYRGGIGGSNGSDGSSMTNDGTANSSAGGAYGGGPGGAGTATTATVGGNGTYYGAGAGGGGMGKDGGLRNNGGNGYQGIVYIRIPLEQVDLEAA